MHANFNTEAVNEMKSLVDMHICSRIFAAWSSPSQIISHVSHSFNIFLVYSVLCVLLYCVFTLYSIFNEAW